ncbi:response regulator transcription factor [Flavivirga jejuensis]|uniref:Helix-turn-helix transcriptional regulator n=1 Tax=Flavivirga jejuensis TaxID=870487 RepID=A0ABT8WLZ3_9FLAO|nr:helix-turn-helix transcriptional regulator [Flavivirga jejuensis]MDO5973991.1 helix-turn-helix transcriptional regulator [Flavivirga jejuensis]
MTAFQEIIKTINNVKRKGNLLSKKDILSVLKATKQITKHKELINSLIFFFTTLDSKALNKIDILSKRELEVLQYIGHGKSSINIAKKLGLSISTIETHRKNIRKKLELVGKGTLIQYAILNNLRMLNSE